MKKTLSEIAEIKSGNFFRAGNSGNVLLYNIADFSEKGRLIRQPKAVLNHNEVPKKSLLNEGDILFAAKGPKNFAWLYSGSPLPAVASSSFYIIKIINNDILPEYLTWYLNQPAVLNQLKRKAMGTSLPLIRLADIKTLPVVIPEMDKQKQIIRLSRLMEKENQIMSDLIKLKETFYQTLLWQNLQSKNNNYGK